MSSSLQETMAICPHCWHHFYADEACYISRHDALYGDEVLGMGERQRFTPHEITHNHVGRPLDPQGCEMTERACPRCHLQIPADLLERRPFFVSLAGCPGSAKTYFLVSMMHHLEQELALSFELSLHASDSHEVRAYHAHRQTLFRPRDPQELTFLPKTQEHGALYNRAKLNGAEVQLPKPFIFSLHASAAHPAAAGGAMLRRNLVVYDNAGEAFDYLRDRESHVQVTQHLGVCDAVVFSFDPLQIPAARTRLAGRSADPQITVTPRDFPQEAVLTEVVNRMRRYRGLKTNLLPVPLLVCIQKYDVWKSLVPFCNASDSPLIDESSIEHIKSHGIAGLDVEEINRISLLLRSLLQELCPQFVKLAEASFQTVRYFPVSALGHSPQIDDDGELKVRPAEIKPFRVTHPLLWLLRHWKIIYRTRRKASRDSSVDLHAQVERLPDGRLKVKSPHDGKLYLLDSEYEESRVIDPACGRWFWIPPAPPLASQPLAGSPPAALVPADSLQLKLSDPPQPQPKRGWFRK